jgi:hypothetical protein
LREHVLAAVADLEVRVDFGAHVLGDIVVEVGG